MEGVIVSRLTAALAGGVVGAVAGNAMADNATTDKSADGSVQTRQGPGNLAADQQQQVAAWLGALAPDPSGKRFEPIAFGSGTPGGLYHLFCQGDGQRVSGVRTLAAQRLPIDCKETGGSRANIKGFLKGKYQAMIAQADLIDAKLRETPDARFGPNQLTIYQEPFWLLVHEKSGIDGAQDLDPERHRLYIGPKGSGVKSSWKNLVHHAAQPTFLGLGGEQKYGRIKTARLPYLEAAEKVSQDRNAVMLMVIGIGAPIMQHINDRYGDTLKLVPFNEDRFIETVDREGQPVYDACTIPSGRYDKLQRGWFGSAVETLCVDAVLAVSPKWVEGQGAEGQKSIIAATALTAAQLRSRMDAADR